jgi:hypothetical protein
VAFALELGPDLVGSIDVEVLGVDPFDLGLQRVVPDLARTARADLRRVVGGGSELQSPTDRLDSPSRPVGVDEANYLFV